VSQSATGKNQELPQAVAAAPRRLWAQFLHFGALSGCGWLLDFAILLALVRYAGLPGFVANVISSCIAAVSVFAVSRLLVFSPAEGRVTARLLLYFGYTLAAILLASLLLGWLVGVLGALPAVIAWQATPTTLAAVGKVIITPPQLAMNFLMSRLLSQARLGGPRSTPPSHGTLP